MKLRKGFLTVVLALLMPFFIMAEGTALEGLIAVIDVEAAILGTEVSKQSFEELATSKEWKEVEEDLKLKINEANEIQEKLKKEGPTMSDDDKLEAQKRLNSVSYTHLTLPTKA